MYFSYYGMNAISSMQEGPFLSYKDRNLKCVNKYLGNDTSYLYDNCRVTFINSSVGKCYFANCKVIVEGTTLNDIWTFINCEIIIIRNSNLKDVIVSNSNFTLDKSKFHSIRLSNDSRYNIIESTIYETLNNEPRDDNRKLAPIAYYYYSYSPITCGFYVENNRIM